MGNTHLGHTLCSGDGEGSNFLTFEEEEKLLNESRVEKEITSWEVTGMPCLLAPEIASTFNPEVSAQEYLTLSCSISGWPH